MQKADDTDSALRAATDAGAQAFITMDDPLIQTQRARIVAFAEAASAGDGRISARDRGWRSNELWPEPNRDVEARRYIR